MLELLVRDISVRYSNVERAIKSTGIHKCSDIHEQSWYTWTIVIYVKYSGTLFDLHQIEWDIDTLDGW